MKKRIKEEICRGKKIFSRLGHQEIFKVAKKRKTNIYIDYLKVFNDINRKTKITISLKKREGERRY